LSARRLLRLDWDAIAGIIAASLALILHLLHVISVDVLITIAVVLIALLFIRNLRREHIVDQITSDLHAALAGILSIQAALKPPDAILIGPASIATESKRFAETARGDMLWFHVCLTMFRPQSLFDVLLRPAIVNPNVESIQFILDPTQKPLWDSVLLPKLSSCPTPEKVKAPIWVSITESISIVVSDASAPGGSTALLSFWGEPFMARSTGKDVPRYIFHLERRSELVPRMLDVIRDHRLRADRG
jgi:hypothetical protein